MMLVVPVWIVLGKHRGDRTRQALTEGAEAGQEHRAAMRLVVTEGQVGTGQRMFRRSREIRWSLTGVEYNGTHGAMTCPTLWTYVLDETSRERRSRSHGSYGVQRLAEGSSIRLRREIHRLERFENTFSIQ